MLEAPPPPPHVQVHPPGGISLALPPPRALLPITQEEDEAPADLPSEGRKGSGGGGGGGVNDRGECLPWNIVEDPPNPTKKELYLMEGSWRLICNQNYDKYLQSIGVTPLMATMVMRSDYMITIYEDIDKCWKILTETSIKARSVKGYKCRNYKMTSNKFMPGEEKPELLEDWDSRMVITTVAFEDGTEEDQPLQRLTLTQEAEKDQKYHMSSTLVFTGADDILTLTCETESGVKSVRKFVRHKQVQNPALAAANTRKLSAPF